MICKDLRLLVDHSVSREKYLSSLLPLYVVTGNYLNSTVRERHHAVGSVLYPWV
jgi:hypothetical protein